MEKRIIRELRGKKPSEVKYLSLEHCRAKTISGLTDEFSQLTALYLEYVGLTSLDGLPKLPALHTIELGDNKLTGGLEILVENCPRLRFIDLSANKIKTIEALEPLKNLSELSELDLFECRVTELPNYRKDMFTLLPQIKYLDGFDINDKEDLSDESEDGEENFGDDKFNSDYEEVFEKKVDGKLNNFQTKLSLVESKNKEAMEVLEKKMNEEIQKLKSEHQNEIKNLKESFQQIIEEKIKEIKETKETQKKIDELEEDTASQKSDLSNGFELLTYNENKL